MCIHTYYIFKDRGVASIRYAEKKTKIPTRSTRSKPIFLKCDQISIQDQYGVKVFTKKRRQYNVPRTYVKHIIIDP